MRKHLLITILFAVLLIVAVGCTNSPQTPNDKVVQKITYTDEFNFLPKHPSMTLKELQKGEEGNFDYAFYTISGTDFEKFFTEYEAILKQDGWTVTQDIKPTGLSVEKEGHISSMALSKGQNEVVLVVTAK